MTTNNSTAKCTIKKLQDDYRFLKSLSQQFPTIAMAATEIINLQSILTLPKPTEHFVSDVHGEYEQFLHTLRNGSGSIRKKIDEEFGYDLSEKDKKRLATLIYYPAPKMEEIEAGEENMDDWYKTTLRRLIKICGRVSSKYTRSKVRKAMPEDFAYIIEELIYEKTEVLDKEAYYNSIIATIVRIEQAPGLIIALCNMIQQLCVDHLHVIGDIFDRGPGAHIILDTLADYHSVDIQWGNHDIVWMGAAAGNLACIANVIRLSARYGNLNVLEEGYGINLLPLSNFAFGAYRSDHSGLFQIQSPSETYHFSDFKADKRMHKAIAILQFKLEGQLIKRRPEFHMENRLLLDKIDYQAGTISLDGQTYQLADSDFPTIDPQDPYALTEAEAEVMERLRHSFLVSEKLQRHVRFLFENGSLYLTYNSNLLYHGCVPLNEDGSFTEVTMHKKTYRGKSWFDYLDMQIRNGYYEKKDKELALFCKDMMWYVWSNPDSPLFGKDKMATFERYYVKDKATHTERKSCYYRLIEEDEIANRILEEFGLDADCSHIINGHIPVESKKGESPVRCHGKVLIIDGGFSRAYFSKTGIAGYTLVSNSYGLRLVAHEPFTSTEEVIFKERDIHSSSAIIERVTRKMVSDTDIGVELKLRISELEELLDAYRTGVLREHRQN